MFTGLIQRIGTLRSLDRVGEGGRISISHGPWDDPLEIGESVAVNGACLTVVEFDDTSFVCDVLEETLQRTTLGSKAVGSLLNLERALRVSDRLGGHIVAGHVDGTGAVAAVRQLERDRVLEVSCSGELLLEMVVKGSVACDGVSLTISGLSSSSFEVNVIPHTWNETALSDLLPGAVINIETDIIAKHVRRFLDPGSGTSSISMDKLRDAGFVS
jgi:riboflavin synthase